MREGTVRAIGGYVKRLRAERGWSQEELAAKAGCSKKTVENVEAGRPVFARSLAEIAGAFGPPVEITDILDARQFVDEPDTPDASDLVIEISRIGNLPPLPKLVIGRSRDLASVKRKFCKPVWSGCSHGQRSMLVVRGWPGVGKTTIARLLAHDVELMQEFPDGALWVSLGPSPQILGELQVWGRAIGIPELATARSLREASLRLTATLADRRMLLIIDDAWDAGHVTPFAVGGRACATLITTRLSSVADQLVQRPEDAYVLRQLTEEDSLSLLEALAPVVVAAYVEELGTALDVPSVKQHLAAVRMLFDYLVVGQVVPMNPAAAVRGPRHVVKRGKTPVLSPDQARTLLDSINVGTIGGLRDRAIIGAMVFSFARVSALIGMNVDDDYPDGKRW